MKINPKAYAEPCGCGAVAGVECPHIPIRCKHEFKYSSELTSGNICCIISEGETRKCTICGFSQVAEIVWRVTPP